MWSPALETQHPETEGGYQEMKGEWHQGDPLSTQFRDQREARQLDLEGRVWQPLCCVCIQTVEEIVKIARSGSQI